MSSILEQLEQNLYFSQHNCRCYGSFEIVKKNLRYFNFHSKNSVLHNKTSRGVLWKRKFLCLLTKEVLKL